MRKAFSLIEILVVMAILIVIAAVMMPRYLGGKTLDGKTIKSPMSAANDSKCRMDLNQVRQGLTALKGGEEQNPATLAELKYPKELLVCPVGGEAYRYDQATGEVHCPHPGHEKF